MSKQELAIHRFPSRSFKAINLSLKARFFAPLLIVEAVRKGFAEAGCFPLGTHTGRVLEKQCGEPVGQTVEVGLTVQKVERPVLDGIERHRVVHLIGMEGVLFRQLGLRIRRQQRFQTGQVDGRVEVLAHRLGGLPGEVLQPQARLHPAIKALHAPTQAIEFQEHCRRVQAFVQQGGHQHLVLATGQGHADKAHVQRGRQAQRRQFEALRGVGPDDGGLAVGPLAAQHGAGGAEGFRRAAAGKLAPGMGGGCQEPVRGVVAVRQDQVAGPGVGQVG